MVNLDAQQLLQHAMDETGLSDWADDGFSERFALAVQHINGIPMDEAGREAAAENIRWLLTDRLRFRSEEHTSELQSLMRISYAVFCLKKKQRQNCKNKV